MRQRYAELGVHDLRAGVTELLTTHGTTIEESLASTVASVGMPDFLLDNELSDAEPAALRTRLTGRVSCT